MAGLGGGKLANLDQKLAAGDITQEQYDKRKKEKEALKKKAKDKGKKRPGLLDWMKS